MNVEIKDPLFRSAVEAIEQGNLASLQTLLAEHPHLVNTRLDTPTEGYFQSPYLLWFVADNPIRHGRLPSNIVDITDLLIQKIEEQKLGSKQFQLGYTLSLVVTGNTPKVCGVQIELIDLLIAAGAPPGGTHGALAHGNLEAAQHLLEKGSPLTLTVAVCLDRWEAIPMLVQAAQNADIQVALVAAAFLGKAPALQYLLEHGADPNLYLDPQAAQGFHSHATALHQAVWSTSLEAVKTLVDAGARLDLADRIYEGTPLGWAEYGLNGEETGPEAKEKLATIVAYLREAASKN